ncbi:hypothetical protein EI94DRAFT_501105 [Lactarius quietus]|nr:hypothetical protein EI94DRAFT_501105 [Lactarius quietus]
MQAKNTSSFSVFGALCEVQSDKVSKLGVRSTVLSRRSLCRKERAFRCVYFRFPLGRTVALGSEARCFARTRCLRGSSGGPPPTPTGPERPASTGVQGFFLPRGGGGRPYTYVNTPLCAIERSGHYVACPRERKERTRRAHRCGSVHKQSAGEQPSHTTLSPPAKEDVVVQLGRSRYGMWKAMGKSLEIPNLVN